MFVVFGFPLASRLVFILHIYICSSRTCEKKCHILIGCLFVNLRLTHKPCLGAINLHALKYKWTKNHLLLLAVVKSGLLTIVKMGITIVSYFSNVTASQFALNIVRKFTPRWSKTIQTNYSYSHLRVLVKHKLYKNKLRQVII